MGKIYSFQLTTNKDGSTGEYRMSHATVAALLGIDRDYVKDLLTDLVKRGYLIKKSNGKNRPATYLVDEAACFDAAAANGFVFPDLAD